MPSTTILEFTGLMDPPLASVRSRNTSQIVATAVQMLLDQVNAELDKFQESEFLKFSAGLPAAAFAS